MDFLSVYGKVIPTMKQTKKAKKPTNALKTKKKVVKNTKKNEEVYDFPMEETQEAESLDQSTYSVPTPNKKFQLPSLTTMAILILVGVVIGLGLAYQGLPFVALVNGRPIFRFEVANLLFKRYGLQTVDGMVTEKLIAGEAQKSGVAITQTDIDAKAQEILKNFGSSMSVEEFLKFQGIERKDFDNQIKLQMTVEKILSKDLVITDSDIDAYIASNRALLRSTEAAALKEEARTAIRDEKIGEKVQGWLEELKTKASIQKFL